MHNVKDFGAKGDGRTKDTAAIQKAIDAGGIVHFPPGVYLSGTLYLRSGGGLDLETGATLLASPDKEDYNADDFCPQNNVFVKEHVSGAHFIIAVEQKDIVIRGGGVIDGNRQAFMNEIWDEHPTVFKFPEWRPGQMVYFCECENIRISDVELNNAPYWTLFLHGCERGTIHGVRIWNDSKTHNGDGIDIDCCRYVTVSDCIIHSGDDCITFRGDDRKLKKKRPCEYITVTN
ncbi:MAG: glycoside hydrolase family 28 protein, partial [Lentisphaeria bacterium]|nr:glycoside hydrolase family 28 protein [Lentisphaeria bacterium]